MSRISHNTLISKMPQAVNNSALEITNSMYIFFRNLVWPAYQLGFIVKGLQCVLYCVHCVLYKVCTVYFTRCALCIVQVFCVYCKRCTVCIKKIVCSVYCTGLAVFNYAQQTSKSYVNKKKISEKFILIKFNNCLTSRFSRLV